ncbi:MAG: hypothetical protein PHI91_02680 [Candidatus Pacebacteria bacterium]|nr:hypothetical protein [Candidatus Paceibacterota bacterium]MDD2757413.1 hypothetical protein [Candidatus Paceibacterota bacterium]MDD3970071.1 hypothetical protein [Candidatus Paceibacterota bacterium]
MEVLSDDIRVNLRKIIERVKSEKGIKLGLKVFRSCSCSRYDPYFSFSCWELYEDVSILRIIHREKKFLQVERDFDHMVNCIVFDERVLSIAKEEIEPFAKKMRVPLIVSSK